MRLRILFLSTLVCSLALLEGQVKSVLAAVSWAQIEPREGKLDFRDANRDGNPLFVPETRGLPPDNLATRALYAFGRHDAIGMSLMAVERFATPDIDLTSPYDVIRQLAPEETFPSASVSFTLNTPGFPQAGLATVEEGVFVNGRWVPGRRLAGDDTNGHTLVLPRIHDDVTERPSLSPFGPSQKGIQRVTLYRCCYFS